MVPIPRAGSWEELNAQLAADCHARRARRLRGHTETIGERFERDRAALLPLSVARFEACDKTTARVSSISLVRYRTNDYSVPTQYGHRQVLVKAYVHRIVIVAGSDVIAEHKRSYEREAAIYDPLHYLALLEHKSRALDQAAPLAGWQLPECFAQLRRLLEARLAKHAGREYIQVSRWESPEWWFFRPPHQYTDKDWEEILKIWKNEKIRQRQGQRQRQRQL